MKISNNKNRNKKLSPVTVLIALVLTNIITALSFGHQPQSIQKTLSWESLYPEHSQVLLQIELKTPYHAKKEIILSNKQRDFYLENIIMINRLGENEGQTSSFDYEVAQESKGIFTILIPTQYIEKLRGQTKLVALPKNTPKIKLQKTIKQRANYELVY